jgi:hypothetical protein
VPRRCTDGVISLLAIAIAALLLPAAADAKLTCDGARRPERDVPLRGLPGDLVAGRVYRLTATLRPDEGVNHAPHFAAEHCGDPVPHEAAAGAGGWFRRQGGDGAGVYVLELRFTASGPWALSFMDRHGRFHDLGLRWVEKAGRRELTPEEALGDGVVHEGTELPGELWSRFGNHDMPGLASVSLEQSLWIFQPGAVLEEQVHLAVGAATAP